MGTNPYFSIEFGDGSAPLPQLIVGSTAQVSYTYQTSGAYNAIVTVYNRVSSASQTFPVS
jgi:PKD repeat protein